MLHAAIFCAASLTTVSRSLLLHEPLWCNILRTACNDLDVTHAHSGFQTKTLRDLLQRRGCSLQCSNKLLRSLRKVESNSTFCYDCSSLSRNDFEHCRGCYTLHWFCSMSRKGVARHAARAMLHEPCCTSHVARAMLHGPCCTDHCSV